MKLGSIALGADWARAIHAYPGGSYRGHTYQYFFTLSQGGIRMGFAAPSVLKQLTTTQRKAVKGKVVWVSTWSKYYAIRGLRMGAKLAAVKRALPHGQLLRVGRNQWYVAPYGENSAVLKLTGGRVSELGTALRALTSTRYADRVLMSSFA
jgi:hypothetical protein